MWRISSDLWVSYTDSGNRWIGFNGLTAPGNGLFSEGNYRVLVIDAGGESVEEDLYIKNNIPGAEEMVYPEINFDANTISVTSPYRQFVLWFYDLEGNLIEQSGELPMGSYRWDAISKDINSRALTFTLYTESENGSWGIVSGPYFFS